MGERCGAPRHLVMRKITLALSVALLAAIVIPATASATWPVASKSSYISQRASRHHPAIDIAAHKGTRVLPIGTGTVVFAGYKSNCGGYQVWIRNHHGLYSAYYHLSRIRVHRGQHVIGDRTTIGQVGRSGCATGPHLHVEVWRGKPWTHGARRLNPWRYIRHGHYLPAHYRWHRAS
jgi:murein DD-endopeptidase MepM/ murein hydrolase activator NlpD